MPQEVTKRSHVWEDRKLRNSSTCIPPQQYKMEQIATKSGYSDQPNSREKIFLDGRLAC